MPLLSIKDAAKRLNCDNRTLRRWIERGTVKAVQNVNGRLAIEESEVARVAELLRVDAQPKAAATSTDARIADLERRVQALERAMQGRVSPPHDATSAPSQPAQKRTHTRRATHADVPPGAITLAQLARELDVVPHTLLDHVKNHGLEHIAVFKRQRGEIEEYERFFTVEQAESARVWHAQFRRK